MKKALEILNKHWNYPKFHPIQEKIVAAIIQKKDSMILLPTGGGKSLCFQVPAMVMEGVCIVVSPLLALINDQVLQLKERNIKSIALNSQMSQDDIITAFDNLQFGNFKFLYLSPEKLQSDFIQKKIKQLNVSLIAIDEAHCISEWGHDFRPSYQKLALLRELKPKATMVALTATATKLVLEDIQAQLFPNGSTLFKDSFFRKNLNYHVIETENIADKLLQILKTANGSIIIYTNSRNGSKETSEFLNRNGIKSSFYHGGLTVGEKANAYETWVENKVAVICATNAFGMGIDKSDVRAVIHINLPASLENYIQEAGRAGRDQQKANSFILTNQSQIHESTVRFKKYNADMEFIRSVYGHLNQYYHIAKGEQPEKIFSFSVQDFCGAYNLPLVKSYNALQVLHRENIIFLEDPFTKKTKVKIRLNNQNIFAYMQDNNRHEKLIQTLLRTYGGLFDNLISINTYHLSKKMNLSLSKVLNQLNELHDHGVIDYQKGKLDGSLQFLVAREDSYTLNRIAKSVTRQIKLKEQKLSKVMAFVNEKHICRNQLLLGYFEEDFQERCGNCDNCRSLIGDVTDLKKAADKITFLLEEYPKTSNELVAQSNLSKQAVINSLKILIDKNKITITSQNKYKLNT